MTDIQKEESIILKKKKTLFQMLCNYGITMSGVRQTYKFLTVGGKADGILPPIWLLLKSLHHIKINYNLLHVAVSF